jgi:uncharacterized membrane protein (DUF485 family)
MPTESRPDSSSHEEHPSTVSRNARIGLKLFVIYVVLYAGFMAMNAFAYQKMASTLIDGINLAVWYGLVLIVGAFVLAMVYMFLVRRGRDSGGN